MREYFILWSTCDILWGTGGICCGEHPLDMLWVICCGQHQNYMLWVICCGQHQKYILWGTRLFPTTYTSCSPQHIKCSPQHVAHKVYVYPVEYMVYVVEHMLWSTQDILWIYIVEHIVHAVDYERYIVDIYCG